MTDLHHFSQDFWDERYRSRRHLWSGRPNPQLIGEVQTLAPGRALDVGCGEGADAIWLAQHGWTVTGIDISPVALQRAAAHGEQAGEAVAGRLSFAQIDLFAPELEPLGDYELVSSQFIHLLPAVRDTTMQRLADAVVPGGHLLFVSHDPADLAVPGLRPHVPDMFHSAPALARRLDPAAWDILVAETRPRPGTGPDGAAITVHDAVLHAERRPATSGS